ncbi:MAG: hypothetical protein D6689_00580, partial [Deltaproteobacteria bacterium]
MGLGRVAIATVATAWLVTACASGDAGGGDPTCPTPPCADAATPAVDAATAPPDATPAPDATPLPDAAPLGGFGDPCSDKGECESNICVLAGIGGLCTETCVAGSCPDGYGCVGVFGAIEPGVVADVCMPESTQLCTTCEADSECSLIGADKCIPYPDGKRFCGQDCSLVECPDGYRCDTVSIDGTDYQQCIPQSGACDCDASTAGATEPCDIATPFGTCGGTRTCEGDTGWSACAPPSPTDEPDGAFADDDCDGIDGVVADGVFVAPTGTNFMCGTPAAPCKTIQFGIDSAVAGGLSYVYIQAGTYDEIVTLASGVHLVGGFDSNWTRDDRNQPGHAVTIRGGLDPDESQYVTVIAHDLTATTKVMDLFIQTPDATGTVGGRGRSSHGVHAANSATLVLERVTITAGDGAPGATGAAGDSASTTAAPSGGGGAPGEESFDLCSTSRSAGGAGASNSACPGTAGGTGGAGGSKDSDCSVFSPDFDATAGRAGTNASVSASGSYGAGGAGGSVCNPGGAGRAGRVVNGAAGSGAAAGGQLIGNYWFGRDGGSGGVGEH